MIAMIAEVVAGQHQREQRADAGRRQRRQDRDRVDVALVEHAEHDVHGDDRGEDQQQLVGERRAEGERRALEVGLHAGRQAELRLRRLDRLHRVAERRAGREVERDRRRRKLADVVDRERRRPLDDARDRATAAPAAAAGPATVDGHVELVERREAALELRLDLEHDAVLVRLREDRRDQPLAERVVERVVDRRRRDAEPARGRAVDTRRRPAGRCPDRSLATSASCGSCCRRSTSLRHPRAQARRGSASSTVNWYCVRLTRSSIVRSCTGCM